jgi:hypothetical protein
MQQSTAIFWPMIAQAMLVLVLYGLLSLRRRAAVIGGRARVSQFRENQVEPEDSLFVRNSINNQFELPVLFHVVCLALYVTGHATILPVVIAWAFVASRYAHAYIHVTSNRIRYRKPLFTTGFVLHFLLWLWLAARLALV